MANQSYQGYYGGSYDRYVSSNTEPSTISKMKETYWTTKQAVITKLGKKQDEHLVASDAELDAKLELFRSIEQSCLDLLRVIEKYQDRLCALSREENAVGRLLKTGSEHDKTRAGKMMAAVGKTENFSSQQLLQLRAPLVRLYQEVEVFRHRAVVDTLMTVERMEAARTEYRGALLWMKDVSEVLDPDTSKQLQKFRMVQGQVKRTKAKFDRLKLDVMQKVDLLAASRSNMFSQVLAKYQTAMLSYWEKMSYRMTAVADSFKGYQYYEFNMLKELGEPSKKLAEETGASDLLNESLDENHIPSGILPAVPAIPKAPGTLLPATESSFRVTSQSQTISKPCSSVQDDDKNSRSSGVAGEAAKSETQTRGSLNNLYEATEGRTTEAGAADGMSSPFIEFGDDDEDVDIDEVRRKQDEEFDFKSVLKQASDKKTNQKNPNDPADLLSYDFGTCDLDVSKDDLTLLNEILNVPAATPSSEFSLEWQAAFGSSSCGAVMTPSMAASNVTGMQSPDLADFFMPSCLLDMTSGGSAVSQPAVQQPVNIPLIPPPMARSTNVAQPVRPPAASAPTSVPKPKKKDQKAEMSAWFNLFAELDPLSNPDAIGRSKDDLTDA